MVSTVAAGIPTVVNQEYGDYLQIPEDWIFSNKHTFALEVIGDSVNGIGIVNKQNTVNNGDIVIAIINQEAAMKKFMLMDSSVLLLSANLNYEPIQIKSEDIIINGEVIEVMKR